MHAQTSLRNRIARRSQSSPKVVQVTFFSRNGPVHTIPCQLLQQSVVISTAYTYSIRWGRVFAVKNQNCLSMVSFCPRTLQHLTAIMVFKIWFNNGAGSYWHILPTLHISPHVITGCVHMWKNVFGVIGLNQKAISTLLSFPLYIVGARMNTELQLIIYLIDEKVCGQCWWLQWVADIFVNIP